MIKRTLIAAVARMAVAGLLSLLALPAMASTGPDLIIAPWPEERQSQGSLIGQSYHGDVRGEDERLRMHSIQARGRLRLNPEADHSPAFGTDLYYANLITDNPALPERLLDVSLAAGLPLARLGSFEFGATAGAGFAGDLPFTDEHAVYGKASLVAVRPFGEGRTLILGVDYHGNRTIFPDIPLPGVLWIHRVNEQFQYTAGFPYVNVIWKPYEGLILRGSYGVPTTLGAEVSYQLAPTWQIYGELDANTRAFHLNDDDRNRRLFFRQRRVEAGVRFLESENGSIILGAGYAFGQRFDRGFDVRSTSTVRRLSDEPYVRFAIEFAF